MPMQQAAMPGAWPAGCRIQPLPRQKENQAMASMIGRANVRALRWAVAVIAVLFALALLSNATLGATLAQRASGLAAHPASPPAAPVATPGQDFQDVFPSDPFYP